MPNNTAAPFLRNKPTWVSDPEEQARLAAYDFYDDLFDNAPDQFRLMLRGDPDDEPIFIPTAKQVVKTLARYVARDLGFTIQSSDGAELPGDAFASTARAYGDLFTRERFFSRFSANKRWGLVRGDMIWWVIADPEKPAGSRISLRTVDPRAYFPIYDTDDPDRILGCDIVHTLTIGDKAYVRRERYLKSTHPDHPLNDGAAPLGVPIAHEVVILQADGWDKPGEQKVFQTPVPMELMPAQITALPVYHIRIDEEPYNPYGRSVLSGMERILLGINQAVSDEDLALAMAGLGFYATDQKLADDSEPWVIGPKEVVETAPGGKFERVSGVASVEPSQTHISYLKDEVFATVGINDVATGQVDSATAESGIALALKLGPIMDEAGEIDLVIKDVLSQMFYDLSGWLAAYEAIRIPLEAKVVPSFGEKLPKNRKQIFDDIMKLVEDKVVSRAWARAELSRQLGMTIPDNMQSDIDEETRAEAELLDPYASRVSAELNQ